MGFTLKVEGNTTIELGTTSITGVKVSTDIPQDSNARSTDLGSTITVTGKILTAVGKNFLSLTESYILYRFFQNRGIIISQHFSFPQCANSAPSLRTSAVCPSVSGRRGEFASTVFDFSTRSIFASLVITG